MSIIKQVAQDNLSALKKPINLLMGGNFSDSEFYHSFGPFIQRDFKRFDPDTQIEFPMNM